METGIQKAVRLAGSQTALATLVGVKPQAAHKWVVQGYVPPMRAKQIEEKMKGKITRKELNPLIFGSINSKEKKETPM